MKPKVFLEYKGVVVYCAYRQDKHDCLLTYWFTLDPTENILFDIRNFRNYSEKIPVDEIIKEAINLGELKPLENYGELLEKVKNFPEYMEEKTFKNLFETIEGNGFIIRK